MMNIILTILTVFFIATAVKSYIKCNNESKLIFIYRSFIGIVFVFSGFVKAVDPLGSTYKFIDYFNAFGLEFFNDFAFSLAILLSVIEFLIGALLLLNIKTKISSYFALAFMLAFTPLTLVLAINNPVSDCGCFGDALILTNWQTFAKNIVILIPSIVIVLKRNSIKSYLNKNVELLISAVIAFIITLFSIYNYENLPVVDYRPYKIGNNISALKKEFYELDKNIPSEKAIIDATPENEREYIAESTYLYEKNGTVKEFTEIPDSTWVWKETITDVISEGYKPPIHDFSIYNDTEGDITEMILNDTSYVFLLISYKINKTSIQEWKKATELAIQSNDKGVKFYCLTASTDDDINLLKDSLNEMFSFSADNNIDKTAETIYYYEKDGEIEEFTENEQPDGDEWILVGEELVENDAVEVNTNKLPFEFYSSDETTLKTIIRSNPGLVLIKNATIINKWHYNNFPEEIDFVK